MEYFLNVTELSLNSVISANSGNQINHWSMNWAQFNYSISHICLAGYVIAYWSTTQEVAGSCPFNGNYVLSLNSVKTFRKNFNVNASLNASRFSWVFFGCLSCDSCVNLSCTAPSIDRTNELQLHHRISRPIYLYTVQCLGCVYTVRNQQARKRFCFPMGMKLEI